MAGQHPLQVIKAYLGVTSHSDFCTGAGGGECIGYIIGYRLADVLNKETIFGYYSALEMYV